MSSPRPDSDAPTLPVTVERAIDAVCEAFEASWRAGNRPDLAEFAAQTAPSARPRLLRELVRIDIYYRQQAGDPPAAGEYLDRFPDLAPDSAVADTLAGADPIPLTSADPPCVEGYELLGELGRGGMAVVWRARDLGLNRDIALKVLPDRFAAGSSAARRFLEEAQITGQLQHPGIPAVHQAGVTASGRPFLAMKLVKGQTLEALLRERLHPSADRARYLAVFEHLCHAVGYAHSRGVVHRDLKPANVMVGAFGEVQVMDWGLAKILAVSREAQPGADPDATSEELTAICATRGSDEVTQAGSLLGTPAYMPPEQAIGAIDQIDARSDVFGLGAVLCVVLTGKPPFVGESPESTRQLAARSKLEDAHARLDGCGAEPELVALCKRCLAAEKADRPRDGGVVASAVAAFRAAAEDRARHAEVERAEATVRAAEHRKRRRMQAALAAAVLAVVAVIAGGLWWWDQVNAERMRERLARAERQARAEQDAAAALDRGESYLNEARNLGHDPDRMRWLLTAAGSAVDRANDALATADPPPALARRAADARTTVDRCRHDAGLLAALEQIRFDKARLLGTPGLGAVVRSGYAEFFARIRVDPTRGVGADFVRDHPFRQYLRAGLFDWQFHCDQTEYDQLGAFLKQCEGDADTFERDWSQAIKDKNGAALMDLLSDPATAALPPARLTTALMGGLWWQAPTQLRRKAWAKVAEHHPGDFWVNFLYGDFLLRTPPLDINEANLRLTVAASLRPNSSGAWSTLGWNRFYRLGRRDEGIAALTWAANLDPKDWRPINDLGCILRDAGRTAEAIRAFRTSIARDESAIYPYRNLGWVLLHGTPSDPREALRHFRLGVEREKGEGDAVLGVVEALIALGRSPEAVREAAENAKTYPECVEAFLAQARANEAVHGTTRSVVPYLVQAADLTPTRIEPLTQLTALLIRYKQPEALRKVLVTLDAVPMRNSAAAELARGDAHAYLQDTGKAIAAYRRARLAEPKNLTAYLRNAAELAAAGQSAEATRVVNDAAAQFPRNAQLDASFGAAFAAKGAWPQAVAAYKRAADAAPRNPDYRLGLAQALEGRGDARTAEAEYRRVIDLDANPRHASRRLGQLLAKQERYAEAWAVVDQMVSKADLPNPVERSDVAVEAAGYAARAGRGDGVNPLPAASRAAALRRSRELVADVVATARPRLVGSLLGSDPRLRIDLNRWYNNADLRSVRGLNTLLLPWEECKAWNFLWLDYVVLLSAARQAAPIR